MIQNSKKEPSLRKSRMRLSKNLFIVFALITIMTLLFFSNSLLENSLREIFKNITLSLAQKDIYLAKPDFSSAQFTSVNSFAITKFKTGIEPLETGKFSGSRWLAEAERIEVEIHWSFIKIRMKSFYLDVQGKGEFKGRFAEADLPFVFWRPDAYKSYTNKIFMEIKNIMISGSSPMPYEVSGQLKAQVSKDFIQIDIFTERTGGQTYLVMDKKDVLRISHDVADELTFAEIYFISHHPVQAPLLFEIKNYAKTTAHNAHLVNPLVPEGSYRHILWNYLLTRQFGAEFAKKVTDAHEIGDREGESDAIHRVDFHNNAIGIRYALEGISEAEVLPRVLSDRNVIAKN